MKNNTVLPQLIDIQGMMKLFGCSRATVYNKYIPKLEKYPTKDNRTMFLFEDVKKLQVKYSQKEYEVVDVESLMKKK